MKKIIFLIIILGIIIVVLLLALLFLPSSKLSKGTACVREHCFEVEIAKMHQQQEKGLASRDHLDSNKGMLFVFKSEDIYSFWMKDTLIPLDMIWINRDNQIVFIKENALPCSRTNCFAIIPDQKATYVLEINGGLVREFGINFKDKVLLQI